MARSQKLVFRWVGKNIEGASTNYRKYITHIQRDEYLRYLDEALTVGKGLFATADPKGSGRNGAKLRAVIFDFLSGRRPFHV